MSLLQTLIVITGSLIALPFLIYAVARLIFTAFFFTKAQYEKRKHHG